MSPSRHPLLANVVLTACLLTSALAEAADWRFQVRFDEAVRNEPFTGRVYIFFGAVAEPRRGPSWFQPGQFLAQDVTNLRPGQIVEFTTRDESALLTFPGPLHDMELDGLNAQAVARFNPYERQIGRGPGNGFSDAVRVMRAVRAVPKVPANTSHAPSDDTVTSIELTIRHRVEPRTFEETRWSKLLEVPSQRLSDFHDRSVSLKAAVMLPASYYSEPDRRYPTIFIIPGFGGTHHDARLSVPVRETNELGVEFLRVLLDPSCPRGHHVFANSANNGPVSDALVHELIPEFDRQFRSDPRSGARFVTGHSSGGWSSLWLQVAWPEFFGGTWSTAPDPVDFRDFQQINLYRPGENMYVDAEGDPRPIARRGGQPVLWFKGFADMERVLGYGGQLHSFEAVFSDRADDGAPRLLWNRDTGRIDPEVAESWKAYDIRLILEENWPRLRDPLRGKLHVHMGGQDTFYLDGATRLLKESLERLGSDAVVEIHPGKDHGTVLTRELRERMNREMAEAYLAQ